MESSSYELNAISSWEHLSLFLFRPLLAIIFVLSLLLLGWFLAWKLVLVHVPLVQEIFGLRKKPVNRKPENRRRLTQFYNDLDSQSSVSQCSANLQFMKTIFYLSNYSLCCFKRVSATTDY